MWNRIRKWFGRIYPIALIIGLLVAFGSLSDRAAALRHVNYKTQVRYEAWAVDQPPIRSGEYESVTRWLDGAAIGAKRVAYLLFARETPGFRLCVLGVIVLGTSIQPMFYPIY